MATNLRPNPFPNSRTICLSTTDLSTSQHFPALLELENIAFHTAGKKFLDHGRFSKPQDMLDELGPYAFCLLTLENGDEDSEIIGTISAKPFVDTKIAPAPAPDGHPRLLFKRPPPSTEDQKAAAESANDMDASKWELLASAVALRVKGTGVASIIMDKCIDEIKRRAKEDHVAKGGRQVEDVQVVLYLSTLQELNENYYLKKGWRTTGVRRFEKGTVGNGEGFGVVEMARVV